jgi:autotransporter-associated beta strand protein
LTVNNTTTFSGAVGELGGARGLSLANTSLGTLNLSGSNSFSGGVTLGSGAAGAGGTLGTAGTLAFTGAGALGTGAVTLTAGVFQPTAPVTLSNLVSLGASGASAPVTLAGSNITFTGPTTISSTSVLNVNNNNTTVFAAPIAGAGTGLTLQGNGTLQLTAANTFTGAVTVLGGTLVLNNLGSLLNVSTSSGITVDQGGTFTLDNTAINLPDIGLSNLLGRIGNSVPMFLNGGTFNFVGNPTFASSESLGQLTVAGGNSTLSSSNGTGGTLLNFAGLARSYPTNTGTINFVAPSGSAPIGTPINQIVFASQATATATFDPGLVTGFTNLVGGSGYTTAPTVTIQGGGGSGAQATAQLGTGANANTVVGITITNGGTGYTSTPTFSFTAPLPPTQATGAATLGTGTAAGTVASIAVNLPGQNYTPGTGETIVTLSAPPTGGTQATAVADVNSAGQVTAIRVVNAGKGYTTAPTVTVSAPAAFITASATPVVTSGVVTAYKVTFGGSGYSATNPPTVTLQGGGGNGAAASAVVNGDGMHPGQITALNVFPTPFPTPPGSTGGLGSGYVSAPMVTIAAPALAGQVTVNTTLGAASTSNILPYATVTSPTGKVDFATNVAGGVTAFTGYTSSLAAAAAIAASAPTGITDLVVQQTGDDTSSIGPNSNNIVPSMGIAALLLNSAATNHSLSISLGGPLTLTAGAIVTTGGTQATISGQPVQVAPQSGILPDEMVVNTLPGSTLQLTSAIQSTGLQATATTGLVKSSGQIFSINPTNGGYGYVTAPAVT